MEPANLRFGGGASETVLHPLVAVALLIAVVLMLFLPRRYVPVPFLLTAFLVPWGQVVVLGGVHFTVYRILVIFGLVRLAKSALSARRELFAGGFTGIDGAFTLCALFAFLSFYLQWLEAQALIKAVGNLLDALGGYFVLRFFVREWDDVERAIKIFAFIAVVLGACMTGEYLTRTNIFGFLGGMPVAAVIRDGRPRAAGPFEVYITAGVFGATLLPLLICLWSTHKSRILAFCGMVGATLMTVTSSSSTPVLAYAAGIMGLCFWPFRKRMRIFRWALVLMLLALQLVMKAPVWALVARIDLTGASSGYQRYQLIDTCLRHFSDWWLIGAKSYNNWGFDMWDLSNQYVSYAVTGGLATFLAFILVISRGFGRLGTARKLSVGDSAREWSIWCVSAALLAHVFAYFGIAYFDQMQLAWYALLAIIAAVASQAVAVPASQAQEAVGRTYQSMSPIPS